MQSIVIAALIARFRCPAAKFLIEKKEKGKGTWNELATCGGYWRATIYQRLYAIKWKRIAFRKPFVCTHTHTVCTHWLGAVALIWCQHIDRIGDVDDNWFIDLNMTILLRCLKAHFRATKTKATKWQHWVLWAEGSWSTMTPFDRSSSNSQISLLLSHFSVVFHLLAAETDAPTTRSALSRSHKRTARIDQTPKPNPSGCREQSAFGAERSLALLFMHQNINYIGCWHSRYCVYLCRECRWTTANVMQSAKQRQKCNESVREMERGGEGGGGVQTNESCMAKIPFTFYNLYTLVAYKNVMSFSCSFHHLDFCPNPKTNGLLWIPRCIAIRRPTSWC